MIHRVKKTLMIFLCLCLLTAAVSRICFGIEPQIVVSGSMEPEIMTGSICFVNNKDKKIKEGDVITFEKGGMFVTHRVIGLNSDGTYVTKGDNNSNADIVPVDAKEVKGTIIGSIPKLGYILAFLSGKTGGV